MLSRKMLFAMAIRKLFIFGGQDDRLPPAARCCLGFFFPILVMSTARNISREQLVRFCQRCRGRSDPRTRTFENRSSSSSAILLTGIFRQTEPTSMFHDNW